MGTINSIIRMNQIGQGAISIEEGISWFESVDKYQQAEALRNLARIIYDSKVPTEYAEQAVKNSGLKPSYTPCRLLLKAVAENPLDRGLLRQCVWTAANLEPEYDRKRAFKLLCHLCVLASQYMIEQRGHHPERYWWHKDLTDPEVLAELQKTVGTYV